LGNPGGTTKLLDELTHVVTAPSAAAAVISGRARLLRHGDLSHGLITVAAGPANLDATGESRNLIAGSHVLSVGYGGDDPFRKVNVPAAIGAVVELVHDRATVTA
jgi:hypothetical protein